METKFTKGKWVYRKGDTDQFAGVIFGGYSLNLSDNDFKIDEENANALLISKAPEMFAFIEKIANENSQVSIAELLILKTEAKQLLKEATEL